MWYSGVLYSVLHHRIWGIFFYDLDDTVGSASGEILEFAGSTTANPNYRSSTALLDREYPTEGPPNLGIASSEDPVCAKSGLQYGSERISTLDLRQLGELCCQSSRVQRSRQMLWGGVYIRDLTNSSDWDASWANTLKAPNTLFLLGTKNRIEQLLRLFCCFQGLTFGLSQGAR